MKTIKKKFGKILVLIIACLSVGMLARASNLTSSEVQIAIDASETAIGAGSDNQRMGRTNSVQTGDENNLIGYLLVAGAAVGLGGICIFKKKRKGLLAVLTLFLSLFFMNYSVYATEETENVNVTIPSSIVVSFEERGENSISDFAISNQSLVPVSIKKVKVKECNDWKLCDANEAIPVNTKQIAFTFEGQCLKADENQLDITITENSSKNCDIQIGRGAWTTSEASETAMQMEFEYTIGQKEFRLTFDANGGTLTTTTQMVYNGDTVSLPSAEREGYVLAGWKDSEGNVYTDTFVMPIGDTSLTASWKREVAYALYIESDSSLRFVRSTESLYAGCIYNGMTVTKVFTGFETSSYSSVSKVPWYDGSHYNNRIINKVIVHNKIKPVSTAYWFYSMTDCQMMDLSMLDTSETTNMSYMFYKTGADVTSAMMLVGLDRFDTSNVTNMSYMFSFTAQYAQGCQADLSNWDVSNVKNMCQMFYSMGYRAKVFSLGDLSNWDVSNVTNMNQMLQQTGFRATWNLDCSKWNVSKVTSYQSFNSYVEDKVIAPTWVY